MTKTLKDYPLPTGTKAEIREWIESFSSDRDVTATQLGNQDFDLDKAYKGYVLREVDSNGGYEGSGEYMDSTFAIEKEFDSSKVLGYIQVRGTYSSWDSSEYDETIYIVNPKEVTKVEFV